MLNVILRRRRTRFAGGGFSLTSAVVENSDKDALNLTFSKAATITTSGWSISTDGAALSITGVSGSGTTTPTFSLSRDITSGEVITISYDPAAGATTDPTGKELSTVTNFSVTNNVQPVPGYTFSNTQEMVSNANGEGVTVVNNSAYPTDGAGNDSDASWEFWVTLDNDSSNETFYVIRDDDDSSVKVTIGKTSDNGLIAQFLTDGSNIRRRQSSAGEYSVGNLIHIVLTKTGEAEAGMKFYVNGSETNYISATQTGTYTGLPALVGNAELDLANSQGGSNCDGQYQIFRQFSSELTSAEVTTLYNSGTPVGLNSSLQAKCVQENLLNGNANADNIGNNGTTEGGATYQSI